MTFEILTRQPLKFYEKNGVKFFEDFYAVDKFKRPVKVFMGSQNNCSTIFTENVDKQRAFYEIDINPQGREMLGSSMEANPKRQGIGEILNLAALIEFHKNKLNYFRLFSLKDAIPMYARYGFKMITDSVDEILHNLHMVQRSSDRYLHLKRNAFYYYPQVAGSVASDDPYMLRRASDVVSNYMKEMSRNGERVDASQLKYDAKMVFTDWEFQTDRNYLNEMLDKHEINYKV
ncbi:hypothetical protein HDR58_02380 [bacterium]|nr:hypothetical protein [bacterium]